VIEKTGKKISEWIKILDKYKATDKKSNEVVEYLQQEYNVPRYKYSTTSFDFLSVALYLRSEEHTSELQSQSNIVCRLLLEKKNHYYTKQSQSPTSTLFPYTTLFRSVIEKTGKKISEWIKILDKYKATDKKSNEVVEYLQQEYNVPRYKYSTTSFDFLSVALYL